MPQAVTAMPGNKSKMSPSGDFADPFMPDSSIGNKTASIQEAKKQPSGRVKDAAVTDAAATRVPREKPNEPVAETKSMGGGKQQKGEAKAAEMKAAIIEELRNETGGSSKQLEASISVRATDRGTMISVSDTIDDPMFEIGSAIPAPAMVLAVEAIAKTLLAREGNIHIFGHTDGRQFPSEIDGNWRLSTERARATYFILLHGGLADGRIHEIAGFADRQLQKADDPLSGENRRIEILLGTT
jgi:chemotaxis protein MotB